MAYSLQLRRKALDLIAQGLVDREVASALGPDGPSVAAVRRWRTQGVVRPVRRYAPEHVGCAVANVVFLGALPSSVGARMGIDPSTVSAWVKKYRGVIDAGDFVEFDDAEHAIIEAVKHNKNQEKQRRQRTSAAKRAQRIAAIKVHPDRVVGADDDHVNTKATPTAGVGVGVDQAGEVVVPEGHSPALYGVVSERFDDDDLPRDVDELRAMLIEEREFRAVAEALVVVLGKGGAPVAASEKTAVVNLLRKRRFSSVRMRRLVNLAQSTYCWHNSEDRKQKQAARHARYQQLVDKIEQLCAQPVHQGGTCRAVYGYRVIYHLLAQCGMGVNEKTIRRIMAERNLQPPTSRRRRYSSYQGENQHCPENLLLVTDDGQLPAAAGAQSMYFTTYNKLHPDAQLRHDFHADAPGKRLVTDITEMKAKDGKIYLSPLVDLYDNSVIAATIATRPSVRMTTVMLEEGLAAIGEQHCPIIHTDRGVHYRSKAWVNASQDPGGQPRFIPSMSRKATSGDNAVAEGIFGIIKRDLFRTARDSENYTRAELILMIDQYITWYNNHRVFARLEYKTIPEYREQNSWPTHAPAA